MSKNTKVHIRRVLEYNDFFIEEKPIDIFVTLKLFSRKKLVRIASILSLHYGNLTYPDSERTLFSNKSLMHIDYLKKCFDTFYERNNLSPNDVVVISTYRTALELWRHIFAIHTEEFNDTIEECDFELTIFKVILAINEKIFSYLKREEPYKQDELFFLNGYLTNDSNNYYLQSVIQPQLYYFRVLLDFIPSNEVMNKATKRKLNDYGIENWLQYFATILFLAYETDNYYKHKLNGIPIINPENIKHNDQTGLFSPNLIDHLCIDEDDYIPYTNDDGAEEREYNIDCRRFRAKPFVRLKNGAGYVVINNQLLCERLFNSLYFDFQPLINGKKESCGFFDFNKGFIEKILFRQTIFRCLPKGCFTFPERGSKEINEKPNEPDLYIRTNKGELLIVECKAIKMNGECRDDGDFGRLLEELHEKIVLKTRNLDKARKKFKRNPEPIGIGQLINHINSIEDDSFEWDKNIPDIVFYYPLLVFEDVRMLQPGLLSIVNRWFYEEISKIPEMILSEMDCKPVMLVSINTFYLYDDFIRRKGLTHIIDLFLQENAQLDIKSGKYKLKDLADFDGYLRRNRFKKSVDAEKWLKRQLTLIQR